MCLKAKVSTRTAKSKDKATSAVPISAAASPRAVPDNSPKSVAQNKVESFYRALESARGKRLLICIKGYPDPDVIGSSLCLKWIGSFFDIEATIVHFEEISHHENRALVKKLDIELVEWNQGFDVSPYDYYAINDSQSTDLPIELPSSCSLLVFVDHHKNLGNTNGGFVDIREAAGSTSAIYTEYMIEGRIRFQGNSAEETKVATALMHGIRSDTDDFVNATALDFRASEYLANHVDKDLLAIISRQSIPRQDDGLDAGCAATQRHSWHIPVLWCRFCAG